MLLARACRRMMPPPRIGFAKRLNAVSAAPGTTWPLPVCWARACPRILVEAYKWFALAVTHGDTNNGADIHATRIKEMTPAQITEAEKRVHDFVPKKCIRLSSHG